MMQNDCTNCGSAVYRNGFDGPCKGCTDFNKWEAPQTPVAPYRASAPARNMQVGGDHYKNMGVEPWDVIDTWPPEQRIGAYRAGALKYLMRMGSKDESAQEIAKGKHYMTKLLEVLEEPEEAAL